MASSRLLDFLIRTANEPELRENLMQKSKPELIQTLKAEHGLTNEQADAVARDDYNSVSQQISKELFGNFTGRVDFDLPPITTPPGTFETIKTRDVEPENDGTEDGQGPQQDQ
jgi:hypothetical protein